MLAAARDAQEQILLHETEKRMKDAQVRADLITCIDFCDAMVWGIDRGGDDVSVLTLAIRDAHDIAHVLEGGDKTRDWNTVKWLCEQDDPAFGPAWPDVRRRMAELIERLEATDEPVGDEGGA